MHAGVVGVIASRSRAPRVEANVYLFNLTGTANSARTDHKVDFGVSLFGVLNAASAHATSVYTIAPVGDLHSARGTADGVPPFALTSSTTIIVGVNDFVYTPDLVGGGPLVAGPTDPYGAAVFADSPVAWYRMNETSGTSVLNTGSFSGIDGTGINTILGAAGLIETNSNTATGFNGSSYISIGSPSSLNFASNFSIEAFVNFTGSTYSAIVSYADGGYYLRVDTAGSLSLLKSAQLGIGTTPDGVIRSGVTSHVVVTFAANGDYVFYVNGQVVLTGNSTATFNAINPLQIGQDRGGESFVGEIAEVALYDHVLPASRVQAHFNASFIANSTMLLMHFNGTAGSQTFIDSSKHKLIFNADDSNQTLSSAYGEYGTTGAAFPTNTGITTPYPSYFDLSGPFTFECTWTAPATFPNGGGGYCLISSNNGTNAGVYGNLMLIWLVTPAGKMQWYTGVYGYSDTRIEFSDLVITPGAKNKLAVTRDSSGVFRGFVNGKLSAVTATDTRDWTQNTGTPLQIGSIHPFNDGQAIIGLDEVRVLNECLLTYRYNVATAEFGSMAVPPPAYTPPPPPAPPPAPAPSAIKPNPLVLQSTRGTLS